MTNDYRIYVDLEYCYPGMTVEKGRPSEEEKRQVVQISAILFDNTLGKEVAHFDILTKPAFEKMLPPFFIELTQITDQEVFEQGIIFPEALNQFIQFAGDYPIWTFNADWGVLRQNCQYFNIPFEYEETPFIRVRPLLAHWDINADDYSSGTLYQAAGLDMQGHVHNALHDVRSMAQAVHVFEKRLNTSQEQKIDSENVTEQ